MVSEETSAPAVSGIIHVPALYDADSLGYRAAIAVNCFI